MATAPGGGGVASRSGGISYGEEGEFYLIFTVSSRSLNGYQAAMNAYQQLIRRYKEKP